MGRLPIEIMRNIVDELAELHFADGALDVQRMQRDVGAVARVNKRWHRSARERLYSEIWLPSNEDQRGRARSALGKRSSPLSHLLRSLEEKAGLAAVVRHLRVPYSLSREIFDQSSSIARVHGDDTIAVIAEIIQRCPNLEQLSGFSAPDLEGYVGIWRALASRPLLKSQCWGMHPSWGLDTREIIQFHSGWQNLETLAICDAHLGTGTLFSIIWFLPSLKHLMLRNLYGTGIHCGTLMMLPALESLRLELLDGITEDGLEKLAHSKIAHSLTSLTLVDMNVRSMETIQLLLHNLLLLTRFALVQEVSPTDPERNLGPAIEDVSDDIQLSSQTLQELCWDVENPNEVDPVLVDSIANGGFPALSKFSVFRDEDGTVQRLCRSLQRNASLEFDVAPTRSKSDHDDSSRSSTDTSSLDTLQSSSIDQPPTPSSSMQQSWPTFISNGSDRDILIRRDHLVGSYVPNKSSSIQYSLQSDIPGCKSIVPELHEVLQPVSLDGRERVLDLGMLF